MRGTLFGFLLLLLVTLPFYPARGETITIGVAASAIDAVRRISRSFELENKGSSVRISFAASSAIARQIEAGAPISVFLSANVSWMKYLAARNLLIAGSRIILLANTLVLIAPNSETRQFNFTGGPALGEWLAGNRFALADPSHVPAGSYGKAALINLGQWASLQNRLVLGANVRDVLTLVERGEVGAGLTYLSDAQASTRAKILATINPNSHPPVLYPAALIAGHGTPLARKYINYLQSDAAGEVFAAHGFTHLPAARTDR